MDNESAKEARETLAAVGRARSDAAGRLVTPWWYHPVLGLLNAGLVLAVALGSPVVVIVGALLCCLGMGILVGAYKERTGMWISGLRAGKASWWACLLMAVYLVCVVAAVVPGRLGGLSWPAWLAAAALAIATVVIGRRFDEALRAQLRSAR
ncbi:hypothetical protein B5P43_14635 [Bacillus sp. SRB_336]|nr:hypothetical protein B5P43_14635 [Bacillus sp. SRB_336]